VKPNIEHAHHGLKAELVAYQQDTWVQAAIIAAISEAIRTAVDRANEPVPATPPELLRLLAHSHDRA
jgi:hypothetical protein